MSRNKASSSRTNPAEQEMHQIWHGVIDCLRLLPTVTPSIPKPPAEEIRSSQDEKAKLDEALGKLNILIALRRGEPGSASSSGKEPLSASISMTAAPSTPSATLSVPGGSKRKRRPSYSASPAPIPIGGGNVSTPNLPNAPHTGGSAESTLTSIPSPLPPGRQGTPLGREMTGKQRKELYHDQLPLLPGRKVVFKEPSRAARGGDEGDEGSDDTWILAVVKKSINQDKNRYEIADADEDRKSFNTTLRSIIPLPDPDAPPHLSSHPSKLEDFPKGTIVLALYPDTTSFYQAEVISAPVPGSGMGLGVRGGNGRPDPGAKKGHYRLQFVDDHDQIQEVDKHYVIAFPST